MDTRVPSCPPRDPRRACLSTGMRHFKRDRLGSGERVKTQPDARRQPFRVSYGVGASNVSESFLDRDRYGARVHALMSVSRHYEMAVFEVDLPVREREQEQYHAEQDQDPSGQGGDHPDD
jgi:hypothetical protein